MLWTVCGIICASALALALLYVFLVCPALRQHPQRDFFKNRLIAHRGLHDIACGIPENSLLAFKNAVNKNLAVEIDIHLTADGEVAVFHDDSLKRMCDIDGKIEEYTLEKLKTLRLSGTEQKIPTLQEVLDIIAGKVMLLIEIKSYPRNNKKLCSAANKILEKYSGDYLVQSFYPPAIRWYKKHRPEICRGQLASNFIKTDDRGFLPALSGWMLFNFLGRPDFISYDQTFSDALPRRICGFLGAIPVGWTFITQNAVDINRDAFESFIFENFIPHL